MSSSLPNPPALAASPFDLRDVTLLDSPYKQAMDANARYLLSLEPERFLHGFRKNAGLEPMAPSYGGWEIQGVAGHSLGHYLSAASRQYRISGDPAFKAKVDAIVAGLVECQKARPDGYVGAIPNADPVWDEIRRGEVRSQGFDLNGLWVPWYTQHKVFAGLLDAYRLADSKPALEVARRLGEWAISVTQNLDDAAWQRMLACEHGGMNESLTELYTATGDDRFLALARKFHHRAILDPLAQGRDELAGKHSNTQVPKVLGLARLYETVGDPADRKTAEFYWDRIAHHHSYVIGGNSNNEHLGEPDRLNDRLSMNTAEVCNTYNLLKLTRDLMTWSPKADLADFYERATLNHILASQDPATSMFCYFVPLVSGARRAHSTPEDSFWCCVGSGMENHTHYGDAIYLHQGRERLYVNLFVPSGLDWSEAGVRLTQRTDFPVSGHTTLTVEQGEAEFDLAIRRPAWAQGAVGLKVNGTPTDGGLEADGYFHIRRRWKAGDQVAVDLPMAIRTEAMPDNPKRVALLYGPLVLAADLGDDEPGATEIPVLVPGDRPVAEWLIQTDGLQFLAQDATRPEGAVFRPFYSLHHRRTAVYLDAYTPDEWRVRQAELREEEARRKDLEARTLDVFRPGEMQPERDHDFQGEQTETGEALGRKWRHAVDGGWLSFAMKVDPDAPNDLVLTYWGEDAGGREFDILVDGQKVASVKLERNRPGTFFDETTPLPWELTKGKARVVIRLQARPGMIAGGLYGARTVRRDKAARD